MKGLNGLLIVAFLAVVGIGAWKYWPSSEDLQPKEDVALVVNQTIKWLDMLDKESLTYPQTMDTWFNELPEEITQKYPVPKIEGLEIRALSKRITCSEFPNSVSAWGICEKPAAVLAITVKSNRYMGDVVRLCSSLPNTCTGRLMLYKPKDTFIIELKD